MSGVAVVIHSLRKKKENYFLNVCKNSSTFYYIDLGVNAKTLKSQHACLVMNIATFLTLKF